MFRITTEGDVILKSMSNPKQLGAKEMLKQSVIYLYNSYREEGLNAQEAKAKVVTDIQETYDGYVETGVLPKKNLARSNPKALVDQLLLDVEAYGTDRPVFAAFGNRILKPKLQRLKGLI